MFFEGLDESFEPPDSDTYAGNSTQSYYIDPPTYTPKSPQTPESPQSELAEDLLDVLSEIRELLARQHKLEPDEFLTELSGVVTSAPRRTTTTKQKETP